MTASFITLTVLSGLCWVIVSLSISLPILLLYYMFIKRARLYCKAKRELKRVLQEREVALGGNAK
ncbi:hypothetical protein [Bartonella sp. ML70XJBT.G]|uniref:hypothetical protein n=1 Tax=Bartonella sp. ML70XJBT.G TaxID=3019093 RepID=UPI00235EFAD9|nr:hypothetical protein [Bartonella sp. ML70XJBT.G]